MKKIAVLGVTGSIGLSVAEVVKQQPELYKITLATAHSNHKELNRTAQELAIEQTITTRSPEGQNKVIELLENEEFDIVINAVSGSAGLIYSYHALKNNHQLALANKESLVMAGHILTEMKNGREIIPIDSEHSAIFQLSKGLDYQDIDSLIITASGGPFREMPLEDFNNIDPKSALEHPTWTMGKKITIDSATMFNKGLEIIEAHWLFNLPYFKIKAVIHPQSIIHSMIQCKDGSIFAQMSNPSMTLPIIYALTHPKHLKNNLPKTKLTDLAALTFEEIDNRRYPLFKLVKAAGVEGGLMPTIINALNEAAIKLFLDGKVSYKAIHSIIEKNLDKWENIQNPEIETILEVNERVYQSIIDEYQ